MKKPKGELIDFVVTGSDRAQDLASEWRAARDKQGRRYVVRIFPRTVSADGHVAQVWVVVVREQLTAHK
jgi:hypothetical protein